eukprot:701675-Prorocentrum_lima.AAC.1
MQARRMQRRNKARQATIRTATESSFNLRTKWNHMRTRRGSIPHSIIGTLRRTTNSHSMAFVSTQ